MTDFDEAPEIEAEAGVADAPIGAGQAALELALRRGGKGGYERDARTFLREQTDFLRLQKEHLHEQRALTLAHLQVRRWKDRISIALQALGALVGAAVVAGLGTMVWQAHEDHGAVIQPFSVPPDLAARGLTGEVAAAKVMDKLAQMQARTDSARAPSTYANNWGDDIKVEIPETGLSVSDLYRLLRRWLGHQTVISGEVVRTPTGLSITARTGEDGGATFEGPEAGLDKLFQQAAEAVYRRTQPYRYGSLLLITSGNPESARPTFESLAADGDVTDRQWAMIGLANIHLFSGDIEGAMPGYAEVDRRWPGFIMGVSNIVSAAAVLDHEEQALDAARRTVVMIPGGRSRQVTEVAARTMAIGAAAAVSELQGDWQTGARQEASLTEMADYGGSRASGLMTEASDLAFDHQPEAAAAILAVAHPPVGTQRIYVEGFEVSLAAVRLLVDVERQDWAAARADGAEAERLAPQSGDNSSHYVIERQVRPWLAYAEAMSGDQAGAEALIAATPLDCDTCVRLRGRIAAIKGDWAGAERWFRTAVRQAPSIPFGYADWGWMLLRKGDAPAAIAKLELAHAKGPHDADALELWGEALIREGDARGAAAKFAEAARSAPKWDRNNRLWRDALGRTQSHG